MNAVDLKRAAARAALQYVLPDTWVGVGSGSTVALFIEELGGMRTAVRGAVSSSERSTALLQAQGIPVVPLAQVDRVPLYVDGADEINPALCMIKGGGGALTREKIVAAAAEQFICIVDASKQVAVLGQFPLPVEVIPMAQDLVATWFAKLGGQARVRPGFVSDNGNPILDVHGLTIHDPVALETEINQWPGVVTVGLFARRPADCALVAHVEGVRVVRPVAPLPT